MKIIIQTQHRENYGVHDWDGEGEVPQYWKNKGGDTFVIRDADEDTLINIMEIENELVYLIESYSDSFQEYIISFSSAEDDRFECEEWETPWVLTRSDNTWVATRWTPAEDWWNGNYAGKQESYTLTLNGARENYSCEYVEK